LEILLNIYFFNFPISLKSSCKIVISFFYRPNVPIFQKLNLHILKAHDFMRGNQALVESVSEHRLISTEQLLLAESGGTQPQPKGSPPHFMQTLVSAVVSEGQSARFEAVVTGKNIQKINHLATLGKYE
jgi:hypothetical protein